MIIEKTDRILCFCCCCNGRYLSSRLAFSTTTHGASMRGAAFLMTERLLVASVVVSIRMLLGFAFRESEIRFWLVEIIYMMKSVTCVGLVVTVIYAARSLATKFSLCFSDIWCWCVAFC